MSPKRLHDSLSPLLYCNSRKGRGVNSRRVRPPVLGLGVAHPLRRVRHGESNELESHQREEFAASKSTEAQSRSLH
jgi:hypothetical protein